MFPYTQPTVYCCPSIQNCGSTAPLHWQPGSHSLVISTHEPPWHSYVQVPAQPLELVVVLCGNVVVVVLAVVVVVPGNVVVVDPGMVVVVVPGGVVVVVVPGGVVVVVSGTVVVVVLVVVVVVPGAVVVVVDGTQEPYASLPSSVQGWPSWLLQTQSPSHAFVYKIHWPPRQRITHHPPQPVVVVVLPGVVVVLLVVVPLVVVVVLVVVPLVVVVLQSHGHGIHVHSACTK